MTCDWSPPLVQACGVELVVALAAHQARHLVVRAVYHQVTDGTRLHALVRGPSQSRSPRHVMTFDTSIEHQGAHMVSIKPTPPPITGLALKRMV